MWPESGRTGFLRQPGRKILPRDDRQELFSGQDFEKNGKTQNPARFVRNSLKHTHNTQVEHTHTHTVFPEHYPLLYSGHCNDIATFTLPPWWWDDELWDWQSSLTFSTTCNLESFVRLCNDTDRRRAHSPTCEIKVFRNLKGSEIEGELKALNPLRALRKMT